MKNQTIVIDLDNTICTETETKELDRCIPKEHVKEAFKKLKENDNFIIIHTGRHISQAKFTIEWLAFHEIPYDHIQFGKPVARIYIDDQAYRFTTWGKFLKEMYELDLQSIIEDPIDVYERVLYENLKLLISDGGNNKHIRRSMAKARKAIKP